MHGFFMDMRLYNRVRSMADPFAFDTWRKQQVKNKVEGKRSQRIKLRSRLPKVNQEFAARLMGEEEEKKGASGKSKTAGANPLRDSRFGAMFEEADFAIDQESDEFKRTHPSGFSKGGAGADRACGCRSCRAVITPSLHTRTHTHTLTLAVLCSARRRHI